jgi:hypothetical protein
VGLTTAEGPITFAERSLEEEQDDHRTQLRERAMNSGMPRLLGALPLGTVISPSPM